jgi:TRAP transporter TAXI family solute receptor
VVPGSFVLDLGSAMKLRMLSISDAEFAELRKLNPGLARYTIKAGVYGDQGISEDVHTIQSPTVLIASSETPEDVVYKITQALVEGREDFGNVVSAMKGITAEQMAENFGMPYHPGAERYFREKGLVKN